jgi:hypothetical protein
MAFGGVQTNTLPNTTTGFRNASISITGLSLAARLGAPNITADDTGLLTSATPIANQNGLPAGFGPGAGNWTQTDLDNLLVTVEDGDSTANATASAPYLFLRALVAGDIKLTIHNRGAGATVATRINIAIPD